MASKLQRGTVYKADGRILPVKPANGKKFSLEELQSAVGGYIETVFPLKQYTTVYCDEEELFKTSPVNPYTKDVVNVERYETGGLYSRGGFFIKGDIITLYNVAQGEVFDEERVLVSETK